MTPSLPRGRRVRAGLASLVTAIIIPVFTASPVQGAPDCTSERTAARDARDTRDVVAQTFQTFIATRQQQAYVDLSAALSAVREVVAVRAAAGAARVRAAATYRADRSAENKQALDDAIAARDQATRDGVTVHQFYYGVVAEFKVMKRDRAVVVDNLRVARQARADAIVVRNACTSSP